MSGNPIVNKPIFLVGTGRCGSTVMYSSLAMHPDLAWISSWVDAFPSLPILASFNRFLDLPLFDRIRDKKYLPKPVEPNTVFNHLIRNYYSEVMTEEVAQTTDEQIIPLLAKIQKYHGKPRFLGKMVGRPVKIELLFRLIPDAFFVHTTRNLLPTVASLMQVDFYSSTGSLDNWKWEMIPSEYLEFFERSGRSDEVAAAIKTKLGRLQVEKQLDSIDPDQWVELSYEDFVASPVESIRRISLRAGLPVSEQFVRRLEAQRVYKGADDKWKKYFDSQQIRNIEQFEASFGF